MANMTMLDNLKDHGFTFTPAYAEDVDVTALALISLDIGLQAYFSTYGEIRLDFYHIKSATGDQADGAHKYISAGYCKQYAETILHIQHFIEITIKDLLRKEHILLVRDYGKNHAILFDLIKGNPVKTSDAVGYEIEFSSALERICVLIREEKLTQWQAYKFVAENERMLAKMAWLRNKLIHRGAFVLRYEVLDQLMGLHILPFIKLIAESPMFGKLKRPWTYANADCGIDPIVAIIDHFKENKNGEYNIDKVALYKAIGRACYMTPGRVQVPIAQQASENNQAGKYGVPNYEGDHDLLEAKVRLEQAAGPDKIEVEKCIVCGKNSLLIHISREGGEEGEGSRDVTYSVECLSCSLTLHWELGNLTGLDSRVPNWFG